MYNMQFSVNYTDYSVPSVLCSHASVPCPMKAVIKCHSSPVFPHCTCFCPVRNLIGGLQYLNSKILNEGFQIFGFILPHPPAVVSPNMQGKTVKPRQGHWV